MRRVVVSTPVTATTAATIDQYGCPMPVVVAAAPAAKTATPWRLAWLHCQPGRVAAGAAGVVAGAAARRLLADGSSPRSLPAVPIATASKAAPAATAKASGTCRGVAA